MDVLAHELGHAQYDSGVKNRNGGKLGKLAHDSRHFLSTHEKPVKYLRRGVGFYQGLKAGRDGEDKEHLAKTIATSSLLESPTLVSEAMASRKGLQLLKQAGATKKQLKASRKSLGLAFGTYAVGAAGSVIKDLGMYGAGRVIGKHTKNDKRR